MPVNSHAETPAVGLRLDAAWSRHGTRGCILLGVFLALVSSACGGPTKPLAVELVGTPREIGTTWGIIQKAQIRDYIKSYEKRLQGQNITREVLRRRAKRFFEIVRDIAPHWLEESEAIARAAGVDAELYMSLPAMTPRGIGFHECTSFALSREASASGALLFHRNRDNVDHRQSGYILQSARKGIYKFIAVGGTTTITTSVAVNEKGLVGSADMGGMKVRVPKYRGLMNNQCLRYIIEKAADCDEALALVRELVDKGYYVGGAQGTRWSFMDRHGTVLEIAHNNTDKPEATLHREKLYVSKGGLATSAAGKALLAAKPPIGFHQFHRLSRDPSVCFGSTIAGMTVEMDTERPDVLTCVWFSFPAKSHSVPVFMGGTATPLPLLNGEFYAIGKTLPVERKANWEKRETASYTEKTLLRKDIERLLSAGETRAVRDRLNAWTKKHAHREFEWLNTLSHFLNFPVVQTPALFTETGTFNGKDIELRLVNESRVPVVVAGAFDAHPDMQPSRKEFEVKLRAGVSKALPVAIAVKRPIKASELPFLQMRWTASYQRKGEEPLVVSGRRRLGVSRRYACERRKSKVVVDGNLDEWKSLPIDVTKPAQVVLHRKRNTLAKGCRFCFGVSYDDEYIYIGVRTTDDKLFADPKSNVWRQDGVEVRLDGRPAAKRDADDNPRDWTDMLPIVVSPAAQGGEMVIWSSEKLPKGTKVVSVRTAKGYDTEIAVPASYLNERQGGKWKDFRMNVAVNDFDAETESAFLLWQPDWRRERTFPGTGTFVRK